MKSKIEKILNKNEIALLRKLKTPQKVQDYIEQTPFNFEERGETYLSPRLALQKNKMHCFEGAIFAYVCLAYHGYFARLLDLKVSSLKKDSDHVICIYKQNGFWGAISKTNHAILRYRDPVYKSVRELAMTYFHEYFLESGEKTLHSYSKPFDVFKKIGTKWIANENDLDQIAEALDTSPHIEIVPKIQKTLIRKASKVERKALLNEEYKSPKV